MKITARVERNHAFVLKRTDIEPIWFALSAAIGPVRAVARCSDDVQRTFDTVESLVQYENSRLRAIRSLEFRARSDAGDTSARLQFEARFSSTIDFNAEGEEDQVVPMKDRVAEILSELRPWYSFISRIDFFYLFGAIFLFLISVLRLMTDESKASRTLSFVDAMKAAALLFGGLACVGAFVWLLVYLRKRFFPLAAFAIGRGNERYEFDDKIRWVVIIGFVVSVFAPVVATLLFPAA